MFNYFKNQPPQHWLRVFKKAALVWYAFNDHIKADSNGNSEDNNAPLPIRHTFTPLLYFMLTRTTCSSLPNLVLLKALNTLQLSSIVYCSWFVRKHRFVRCSVGHLLFIGIRYFVCIYVAFRTFAPFNIYGYINITILILRGIFFMKTFLSNRWRLVLLTEFNLYQILHSQSARYCERLATCLTFLDP